MKLKDKVAIVTGGASGVGRAIALGYAREGAHVAVADLDGAAAEACAAEITQMGRTGLAVETDVADGAQIERMVQAVLDKFARVDILVNAAALVEPAPLLSCTAEQWERAMQVNLDGVLFCTQAVCRVMAEQKSGKIINITSMAAYRGRAMLQAYSAAMGAVHTLTMSAAAQMGPYGVRVNAIAPGIIETSSSEPMRTDPEAWSEYVRRIPLRCAARAEDMVGPAVFLASSDSDYVTGVTLPVDGGRQCCMAGVGD